MMRSMFGLVPALVLCAAALAEEIKPAAEIGGEAKVPANIGLVTNVSDDKQAATILFDNLLIDLDPTTQGRASTHNQTAIQTKLVTLHVSYSSKQERVTMHLDVRGYRSTDAGASVRLVACVGDSTHVVNTSAEEAKRIQLKGKSKCPVAAEYPEVELGDFQDRIEFSVERRAANPVLQITLLLIVEHDTDAPATGAALLAVDSLDLSIESSGNGASL